MTDKLWVERSNIKSTQVEAIISPQLIIFISDPSHGLAKAHHHLKRLLDISPANASLASMRYSLRVFALPPFLGACAAETIYQVQ